MYNEVSYKMLLSPYDYINEHMDTNKRLEKKARLELLNKATSNLKQILEATPPQIHQWVRRTGLAGHLWRSKNELMSDVLLWSLAHGQAIVGRPAKTYVNCPCTDTGSNLEDLPGAMGERHNGGRESGNALLSSWFFDDNDIYLNERMSGQ